MKRKGRKGKKPKRSPTLAVVRPAPPIFEPRSCPWLVTLKANTKAFAELYDVARTYAKETDRWCEVQPDELQFHFADEEVASRFVRHCREKKFEPTYRDKRKPGEPVKLDATETSKKQMRDDFLMVKTFPETRTYPMRLELAGNYSDDAADFYHRYRVTFYSEEVDYQGIKSRRAKAYVDLRMALEALLKAVGCLRSPYTLAGKSLVKAIRAYSHDIEKVQEDALRGIKIDEKYVAAISKCNVAPVDLRYQFDAMNFRVPNDENYYNTIGSTAWLKLIEGFVQEGLKRLKKALGRRSKIVPGSIAILELKRPSDYPSG
jgi:hypothetical protein